jgi:ABC-2 type transport system permease protein
MRRAIAAEWGKTWSLRATWFGPPAAVLLTVIVALTLANDFVYDIAQHRRPATDRLAVLEPLGAAMQLGQLALVALAMLIVTSEYGNGVIRATFLARPCRRDVLLAKTVVAVVVGLGGGLVSAAVGWWAARLALGSHATLGAPGPDCLRLALVAGLACAFTTAVASVLRSGAGTLTVVFILLVGLQVLDPRVGAYTPAGSAVAFVARDSAQYPWWVGAIVLAGWVLGAQVTAHVLLTRRDA